MTDRDLQNKRFIAAGIDIAIAIALGLAFGIVAVIMGFVFGHSTGSSGIGNYVPRVISFLGALFGLAYILSRDILAGDRSLGKKLQDLRVVSLGGGPIGLMESVRRNALFGIGSALGLLSATLQLLPCLGDAVACLLAPIWVLGALVALGVAIYELIRIAQDPQGIRLGDQFANTKVTR